MGFSRAALHQKLTNWDQGRKDRVRHSGKRGDVVEAKGLDLSSPYLCYIVKKPEFRLLRHQTHGWFRSVALRLLGHLHLDLLFILLRLLDDLRNMVEIVAVLFEV